METTSTDYKDFDVWEYTVYWRDGILEDEWKRKCFASKKGAKDFAKRRKNKTKPHPYITQTITLRTTFRNDVECEICKKDFKNLIERSCYRKLIKY